MHRLHIKKSALHCWTDVFLSCWQQNLQMCCSTHEYNVTCMFSLCSCCGFLWNSEDMNTCWLWRTKGFPVGYMYSQKPEPRTIRNKSQGYPCFSEEQNLNGVQYLFVSATIKHKAPVIDSYRMVVTLMKKKNHPKIIDLVQKRLIHLVR